MKFPIPDIAFNRNSAATVSIIRNKEKIDGAEWCTSSRRMRQASNNIETRTTVELTKMETSFFPVPTLQFRVNDARGKQVGTEVGLR